MTMTRPVFGQDRDPMVRWSTPTPSERDAQFRREQAEFARKHPVCACECPECDAEGLHERHDHGADE